MNEKEDLIYSLKIEEAQRAKKKAGLSKKQKVALVLSIALALFLLFFLRQWNQAPGVEVIRSEIVQEGLPDILLTAGGYVEADSTILVSSQINGKIKTIFSEEGKWVKKGEVLAEIEEDDYRSKYNLAQAEFNLAAATLNRKKNLYQAGVISRAEYDEALKTFSVTEASFKSAEYFLGNTQVRAPIEGTIIKKEKEPGEFLLPGITSEGVPGTALFKLADLRVMNVEMDILESDLPKVVLDGPAMAFPDALPDQSYKAKVFYIAPKADKQKSIVQVKVRIENPGHLLKPEMSARVYLLKNFPSQSVERRVKIPESALLKRGTQTIVFILQKDVLKEKQVKVSSVENGFAKIAEGLLGDESVVVNPKERFQEGMKVVVKVSSK
ncbi:MAG: efflux RND transporter periplasmic adaptor subunit [Deltaproteobacteria bacterium]|nr:efflux RND transporter periplasmic adaptor subunit [Deltaproteobacteria bacterium]